MNNLTILHDIPNEFLEISYRDIKKVFDKPTLIHLKGDKSPALFVSILLHGNEFSGLQIMQEILEKYKTTTGYKLPNPRPRVGRGDPRGRRLERGRVGRR